MSNEPDDTKKEGKELKMAPWKPILNSQVSFLNDLECIGEMVSLVLPVLKNRDEEREERTK